MKKKILLLVLVASLAITGVVGCGKTSKKESDGNSTSKDKDISEDEKIFNELFDINNRIKIKIDISDKELAKLQQDYDEYQRINSKSSIYRIADKVTITIGDKDYEIEEVGIRMKGNTSRESFYNENDGMYNLIHFRLSFDETFDDPQYYGTDAKVWTDNKAKDDRKKRTFATLSSLELKWNRNLDTTYVREYYANEMFRAFGVMSQHQNLSNINMAGLNLGVYNIYEPVDKKFISKYYDGDEAKGDLYKAAWTMQPASYSSQVTYGAKTSDSDRGFNYELKTNKKTSDNSSFKNLLSTINDNSVTKEKFASVVDMDYWVKFAAVSYFVGNPDDMRNNYNNHYVYFKPDGHAVFIPYDNDRVFGITVGWNPESSGMTAVSPYSEMAEGLRSPQFNSLYIKTVIHSDGFLYSEYNEKLAEIAKSEWMTEEHFEKYYEIAKKNYEDCVVPDKDFENASKYLFKFSLESGNSEEHYNNISMKDYLARKLETYNNAVKKQ